MKRLMCVLAVVWLGQVRVARAELPSWCGKELQADESDLRDLKRSEPEYVVRAIAKTRCSNNPALAREHARIDAARQAWSKKLGMIDADWADAVAFIDNRDGEFPKIDLSTKVMAQFTAMDQYQAIRRGLGTGSARGDFIYVADALHDRLTEVGRLAFIEQCLSEPVRHEHMGRHAVCQGDIDVWSPAKFAAQLRGDSAHDGGTKMLLRLRVLALAGQLERYTQARDKQFKADSTYKQLFEIASKARGAWARGVGADKDLLDLVLQMDSATFAASRKQFDGCEQKTTSALAKAVSTIPAKAFAGMTDVRDDPYAGFAHRAGPVLVNTPVVNLAANAWAQCHHTTPTADFLKASLQQVAGVRGPRSAAFGAVLDNKLEYDDANAGPLWFPEVWQDRPYSRSGGSIASAGGVVDKVKLSKDVAVVSLQKTSAKRLDCVKSHRTNRVTRIRSDGSLEYETICDASAVVTYDTTWSDFKVNRAHAPLLKRGVVFSSYYSDTMSDVLAVWPSKTATVPSIVLGAKLK